MRHIDNAHDAESDGEARSSQQQHRAERDAVPDILDAFPEGESVLDAARGVGRGEAYRAAFRVGGGIQQA